MKRLIGVLAGSLFAATLAPAAEATIIPFGAFLSGPQESPSNASPGVAVAMVVVNTAAHSLNVQITFNNLLGLTTASHIHCCVAVPANGTAGVATELPSFSNLPLGVTSGSFSQTFNLWLDSTYNPAFEAANGGTAASAEAALLAGMSVGKAYVNIHTSLFPGGEIRGFLAPAPIEPIPEPASMALLGAGLAGAYAVRRRRKKA